MLARQLRKIAYIAGPYSSRGNGKTIEQNIEQAEKIAIACWEAGIVALCPHKNTAGFENKTTLSNEEYIRGDLSLLGLADMLILTPDWHLSNGAIQEVARAIELGIPHYVYTDDLNLVELAF